MPGATLKDAPITSSCYGITTQCIHHDPNKAIIFSSGTLGDACPEQALYNPDYGKAAVRCCNNEGTDCDSPFECDFTVKYEVAESKCRSYGRGWRLCHPSEFRTDVCCSSGCRSGNLVWANKAKSMYI